MATLDSVVDVLFLIETQGIIHFKYVPNEWSPLFRSTLMLKGKDRYILPYNNKHEFQRGSLKSFEERSCL